MNTFETSLESRSFRSMLFASTLISVFRAWQVQIPLARTPLTNFLRLDKATQRTKVLWKCVCMAATVTKYIWDAWDPRAQISYVFSVIPPFVCKFRTITRITKKARQTALTAASVCVCECVCVCIHGTESVRVWVSPQEYAVKCDEGQVTEQVKRNRNNHDAKGATLACQRCEWNAC